MAADTVAHGDARPRAVMVSTMQYKRDLVFNEEGFQLHVSWQSWETTKNCEYILFFLKKIGTIRVD